MKPYLYLITYYAVINVIGIIYIFYDKMLAAHKKRRIPEKRLLYLSLSGGAFCMYITMLLIRHKTRQRLFMISLPLMIITHLFILYIIYHASI